MTQIYNYYFSLTHIYNEAFCVRFFWGSVAHGGEALRAVVCHRTPKKSVTEPSSYKCVITELTIHHPYSLITTNDDLDCADPRRMQGACHT